MLFWNFHSPGKAIRGWKCLHQSTFKLAALLWVPEVKTPLWIAFMKKLLFHLKDVYLEWPAKSSEETNYIWSSNKVLPLLCSNGLKTEAYLEWYVKDSDSLGNRHPRVFGSRSFICIRPFKFQRELFCIFVMKWFDHKYMEKYNHPTSRIRNPSQC